MVDYSGLCDDLDKEQDALDALVSTFADAAWDLPTPAEPWSVRDQMSHLAFFEEQARFAAVEPEAFLTALTSLAEDVEAFMNEPLERGRALAPAEVLEWWRTARSDALNAFRELDPKQRVPWFGPPMSTSSFVTARIMETWAHGQDIVDALAIDRPATDRLRHICHIGVRARGNSYAARGLTAPSDPIRVELRGPSGEVWMWDREATQSIIGDALDFCLVVTQRRHLDDTDLVMTGPLALEWMSIAQAFAGPPGAGRKPGQFALGRA